MVREEGLASVRLPVNHFAQSTAVTNVEVMHPNVAILLCTMQGQHYLREQLDSILWQSHVSWSIWASDDGSDDGTHAILDKYQSKLGKSRLSIGLGPAKGY